MTDLKSNTSVYNLILNKKKRLVINNIYYTGDVTFPRIHSSNLKTSSRIATVDVSLAQNLSPNDFKFKVIDIKPIGEWLSNKIEIELINMLKEDPALLQFIPNSGQSYAVCRMAIDTDVSSYRYVNSKLDDIKHYAVDVLCRNSRRFQHCFYTVDMLDKYSEEVIRTINKIPLTDVLIQTDAVCLEYVKRRGKNLRHVINQTKEIQLEAVKQNWKALKHVKGEQDEAVCKAAINKNGKAIRFVKDQDKDMCLLAVMKNPDALRYIRDSHYRLLNETKVKTFLNEYKEKRRLRENAVCIKKLEPTTEPVPMCLIEPVNPNVNVKFSILVNSLTSEQRYALVLKMIT